MHNMCVMCVCNIPLGHQMERASIMSLRESMIPKSLKNAFIHPLLKKTGSERHSISIRRRLISHFADVGSLCCVRHNGSRYLAVTMAMHLIGLGLISLVGYSVLLLKTLYQ